MSKLGNIYLSYGKQFNIAIANTYSNIVLSGNNLPINTIIISSNIDENNDDTGTYSLLATDNDGSVIRLTYFIKTGNGISNDGDILYLNIDSEKIKLSDNGIYIDLSDLKNNFINVIDDKLSINNDSINIISNSNRGTCRYDNKTIKSDEDTIYIDTDLLQYSNNSTEQYGIINSSDNYINIDNGIVSLNQSNLPKSSNEEYGVCKSDFYTTNIDSNNLLEVNTSNLTKSDSYNYGMIKVDGNKILSNNGLISVDTSKLKVATDKEVGIIGIDNNTIKLNSNNQITIPDYNVLNNDLSKLYNEINDKLSSLETLEQELLSQIK